MARRTAPSRFLTLAPGNSLINLGEPVKYQILVGAHSRLLPPTAALVPAGPIAVVAADRLKFFPAGGLIS